MKKLGKYWAHILVRGIAAVIFGLFALFMPGMALQVLVLVFGFYSLLDGIIALVLGVDNKSGHFLLEGIIGILVGLYIFFFPAESIVVFILLIGIWAFITGAIEILAGLALRKHLANEIFLVAMGIVSVIFGVVLFMNPMIFALTIAYVIGIYALVFGILLILLALKLKDFAPKTSSPSKKKKKK